MRTTAVSTLATDGITLVTSRWVITKRASGYTRSSASMLSMCAGVLTRHRDGGRCHCRSFSTRRWIAVRRFEVALVEQPLPVLRCLRQHVERHAPERHAHEIEAFRRPVGRRRQHRPQLGRSILHLADGLLRGEEPGVGGFGGDVGWGSRLAGLPLPQRAHVGVLREQIAERGGTGAREAEPDEHRLDLLVVDLRMAPVPVLDLQAASEERQHDAGERLVAVVVEIGVFVRGPYEHAQAFDHRVTLGTEVTRPRRARPRVRAVRRRPRSPPGNTRHTTPRSAPG